MAGGERGYRVYRGLFGFRGRFVELCGVFRGGGVEGVAGGRGYFFVVLVVLELVV